MIRSQTTEIRHEFCSVWVNLYGTADEYLTTTEVNRPTLARPDNSCPGPMVRIR